VKNLPIVTLKPGKDRSIRRFHPWIFSGAIATIIGKPEEGAVVLVQDSFGTTLGTGHFQTGSITVRVLHFGEIQLDEAFWNTAIFNCFEIRKRIGFPSEKTNIFRLVHGEGDGLPGLIVDVYADTAVIQCHSIGMYKAREIICKAILEAGKGIIANVYDKSAEAIGAQEGNGFLVGELSNAVCFENGKKFDIDFVTGQKTGFFIDQRDNRALLGTYAKDKIVLNTFCYSGGFSVYALAEGANYVESIDSSKKAIELTDKNVALNGFSTENHTSVQGDVMEWIKQNEAKFDVVVLDPPAFAKHMSAKHRAVQAYKRLNRTAMEQIAKNGILFTFSCSQVVDRELFRHTVTAAAIESGREVVLLHQLTQPADHPVSLFHPEGEYLKGLVLLVK
jgi:23S rRNA (cytosine1962-C5)-methyltransferase